MIYLTLKSSELSQAQISPFTDILRKSNIEVVDSFSQDDEGNIVLVLNYAGIDKLATLYHVARNHFGENYVDCVWIYQ